MAKRNKSSTVLVATDLGFYALVFDEHDVARLLRAAVEREGGQSAFAKHHGVDRAYLNMIQRFPLRRLSAFWAETQSAPS